jgi:ribosome biogenesis GTPase
MIDDRSRLLRRLAAEDFAVYEATLYLDVYPDSTRALAYYRKHSEEAEKLRAEYIRRYGPLSSSQNCGYIADTPGFSMLDFARFDFFDAADLPLTMREFDQYIGQCRYTNCSHTKEEGCAIVEAVKRDDIATSRHESFRQLYDVLKAKKKW